MTHSLPRRGAALIAVLVAIAAITITLTVVTIQVVAQRKLVQTRQQQLQADWLARAGIEWAADCLLQKPSAFTEDKADFAPDWTVHIVAEKSDKGVFVITTEATLRNERGIAMVREAAARFRRSEKGARIQLERLAVEP